jgi:hypothetical protein
VPANDPTERALQAQLAANLRWSREDPKAPDAAPARARAGLEAKFLREADPDGVLPEPERQRRAALIRTAYYQRLALASLKARRRKPLIRPTGGGEVA